MKLVRISILPVLLTLASACGRPFAPATPSGFVELDEPRSSTYDYRATTADGVVVSIRVVKHRPRGELVFWERAIENQLRDQGGYSLLDKRDVQNQNGTAGRQLRFGHDEAGDPHLYYVTIFATKKKLFIVEAGGTKEQVEASTAAIEEAIRHFRIKRCWKLGC
ncbi:MAG: serine/threonine protein kinase [Polyangiaceae bacterium]|nr:serine/threonine protein kinase [Polyangiaceae bacterium]